MDNRNTRELQEYYLDTIVRQSVSEVDYSWLNGRAQVEQSIRLDSNNKESDKHSSRIQISCLKVISIYLLVVDY